MEQEHKPRTSMILLLEHVHAMDELTDEEFGAFIRNYAQYVETGFEPVYDNDRAMRMIWKVVKSFDDMNAQKIKERSEKNRRSINKRWSDKKYIGIQTNTNDTNVYECIPEIQTNTNDTISVSDSVTESVEKEKCEKKNTTVTKRFKAPTIEEAKAYFAERGCGELEAERFIDHFTANGWKVSKNPMKGWKAAARNWMRNVREWGGGYQQTKVELPDEGDFLR